MERVPKIISVTDLRQDSAAVLEAVRTSEQPIVITQRSRAVAVLLSVEAYEKFVYEREVLGILAKGEKEIEAAKGFSLEKALADADALLGKAGS